MNKIIFPLAVLAACLLTACGGGGGDSSNAALNADSPQTPSTTTGSVPATLDLWRAASYIHIKGDDGRSRGELSNYVQDTTGAMTTLDESVLSSDASVKEVIADADFAQGRWASGTVLPSQFSSAKVLGGTTSAAEHYVVFNTVKAFPKSGTASCDAGNFTLPNHVGGGPADVANYGTTTGHAAIAFSTNGATVSGALNITAGNANESASLDTTLTDVTSINTSGIFQLNGTDVSVGMGTNGTAGYSVLTGYVVALPNGARYSGVASFRCK